ncbi:MAG: YbjN domain-containing protein [Planctomycetes bacterium]|nr:YbjN domain-containing protein [Planctomycetota bacterium]
MTDVAIRVEAYLSAIGDFHRQGEDLFLAKRGSAVVAIRIEALETEEDSGDHLVHVEATVVVGSTPNVQVLTQLLEFNYGSAFGAFGLDEEGAITVHHSLLGSALTQEELQTTVVEIAQIADDWDDVIVDLAGGQTAIGRLKERASRPKPTIDPPKAEEPVDEESAAEEPAAGEPAAEEPAEGDSE